MICERKCFACHRDATPFFRVIGLKQRRYDMCDVIYVRRQLTHKGMRIARMELQSLSRSLVSTVQLERALNLI